MAGALSSGYDSAPDVDGRRAFLGIAGSSAATCSLCPVSSKMSCDRRNSASRHRVTFSERTLTGLSLSLSLSVCVCVWSNAKRSGQRGRSGTRFSGGPACRAADELCDTVGRDRTSRAV